jgi:tetratricopeptide (TPR) repeat protein
MLRHALLTLAFALWTSTALAATEEDRRNCAATQDQDARIEACTRVLEDAQSSPSHRAIAFRGRGVAYLSKKLPDLAILEFDEALKLNAEDASSFGNRARALRDIGQYDRAIADYSQLLRILPRSHRALMERGLVRLRKNDLAEAMADLEAAIKISPTYVFAHVNRGVILAKQGKLDEAIAAYDETLRLDPNFLGAFLSRARAREAKGELELAIADYKRAAEYEGPLRSDDDRRAKTASQQRLASLARSAAEPKGRPEKRTALVIGNSAYLNVPALRNPANDAKALAAALRKVGFGEVREVLDAKLSDLVRALKDFGDQAAGADWAVIYFGGHGIEVGGVNYLIPVDATLEHQNHIEDEALPLSRVLSKVAGASRMQLVILDACRNNPFAAKMRMIGRQSRSVGRGLASIEPESGVLVAYAARDGTTALDGDGDNSPYAEALTKYLPEAGLEISLLFRKVRDEVLARTGRQQEPYTYGSLPAQPFYFRR